MKLYFLVTEGVSENDVTIVSEKVLLEILGERYCGDEDAEWRIKRTLEWAVDMTKGSTKEMETTCLADGNYYLCKSMAQVKSIKKREIRLQIEFLKEQMHELEEQSMNVKSRI